MLHGCSPHPQNLLLLLLCHLAVCLEGFGEPGKTLFSGTLSIVQLAVMQKHPTNAPRHEEISIISNFLCIFFSTFHLLLLLYFQFQSICLFFLVFYSYLSFNTVRYLACLAKPFIRHVGCLVFSAELEVSPSISISPAFPLVLVPVSLGLICIRSSITLRFLLFSFPLHFSCLLFSLLSPLFTPPSKSCWVAWILIFSSPGVGWAEGGAMERGMDGDWKRRRRPATITTGALKGDGCRRNGEKKETEQDGGCHSIFFFVCVWFVLVPPYLTQERKEMDVFSQNCIFSSK